LLKKKHTDRQTQRDRQRDTHMEELISNHVLLPLEMNNTGRPMLLREGSEEEIEIYTASHISLYNEEHETDLSGLTVTITTVRILLMNNDRKLFYFIELRNVVSIEKRRKLFASPKVVFHLDKHLPAKYIMLSFKQGRMDDFYSKLEVQLKRKNWIAMDQMKKSIEERNRENQMKKASTPTGFSASSAGLTGIINKVQSENKETEQKLSAAFSDLNSLMEKARELVEISEKFAEKLRKQNSDQREQDELDDVLMNLGLSSVVTKQSAGNMFYQQLARQLAEFLPPHLNKNHGLLALSDAFCLYNRARGTDLISPSDMYKACSLFEKLNLPMRMKKFQSGVIIIQSSDVTDEKLTEKIVKLIQTDYASQQCVSAVDIAHSLKISVVLAQQQLLNAEKSGVLCRDESIEGIRFYLTSLCFPI